VLRHLGRPEAGYPGEVGNGAGAAPERGEQHIGDVAHLRRRCRFARCRPDHLRVPADDRPGPLKGPGRRPPDPDIGAGPVERVHLDAVWRDDGDGVDFRDLPEVDGAYDVAVFDPPYVCVGGRTTTGLPDMHDRYGLTDAPRTPAGVQALIDDGLAEVARVVRHRGLVLVKCQDYITSGRLWPGTHHTTTRGLELGLRLVDRLEYLTSPRPQPSGRRQVHARRNLSTLLVWEVRR